MTHTTLDTNVDGRVLTVTLSRPEQLNAFTPTMAEELIDVVTSASDDDAVRAVVLTGAGRAFCAGMDLSADGNVFGLDESLSPSMADLRERIDEPEIVDGVRDTGGRVVLAVYACKKPVVAAINGAAVGVGATMTLPMDARLASGTARIGFVFGKLGIVPEACSSWFLPRLVGLPTALDWVYSGEILDARQALEGGLVQSVHAPGDLVDAAHALVRRWTDGRSPVATALARQMMLRNPAAPHPVEAHRVDSLAMFATSIGDGKEGVRAFLEKRDPVFTGRASDMPLFYPWWDEDEPPAGQ